MTVTTGFCPVCKRHVHVADGEPLSCPVCSSPLIEAASSDHDVADGSHQLAKIGPEIYLG